MKLWMRVVGIVVVGFVGWWTWQRVFVTDETRVKRLITSMKQSVEQGNVLRLSDAIAQDYSDDFGADKSMLLGGIRSYHQRYQAIFIYITDLKVTVEPDRTRAMASLLAKVAAKPNNAAQETELFADRFRLYFRKGDDGWKLTRTESPELKFD